MGSPYAYVFGTRVDAVMSFLSDIISPITDFFDPVTSLVGDIFGAVQQPATALAGFEAQKATNDTNLQIANNANQFNAEQAGKNRDFQASLAGKAMDFSQASADKQMAFQDSQSSTVWQRAVRDMESAGLNPMLAYSKGGNPASGGASASGVGASGSTASAVTANMQNPVLAGAQAASLGATSALSVAQAGKVEAETGGARAQSKMLEADVLNYSERLFKEFQLKEETNNKLRGEIAQLLKEGELTDARTALEKVRKVLLDSELPEAKAMASYWSSEWGSRRPYQEDVSRAVGAVRGGASAYDYLRR